MGTRNCPCRDCVERMFMCHGRCERYQSWKTEYETAKDAFILANQRPDLPRSALRRWYQIIKEGRRRK